MRTPAFFSGLRGGSLLLELASPSRHTPPKPHFRHPAPSPRGFTVVELVLVIMVIGILSAVMLPRMADSNVYTERLYAEDIATALRYAQKYAIASGCTVQASVAPGSWSLTLPNGACGGGFLAADVLDPSSGLPYASANSEVEPPTAAVVTWGAAPVTDLAPLSLDFGPDGRVTGLAAETALVIAGTTYTVYPTGYVQ